jgi:hypothetical protein
MLPDAHMVRKPQEVEKRSSRCNSIDRYLRIENGTNPREIVVIKKYESTGVLARV